MWIASERELRENGLIVLTDIDVPVEWLDGLGSLERADVLEIGLGMGFLCRRIHGLRPRRHVVVEREQGIVEAVRCAELLPETVDIVVGEFPILGLQGLRKFDFIFMDYERSMLHLDAVADLARDRCRLFVRH